MPAEKSVLTSAAIRKIAADFYGICVNSVHPLSLGTANCFRLMTDVGFLLLKEFPTYFTSEEIDREATLTEYLARSGFPTARIRKTRQGNYRTEYAGHLLYLQDWVEGKCYPDSMPRHLLLQTAELLGRMHTLLRDFSLPRAMDEAWIRKYSAEKSKAQYDELLRAAQKFRDHPLYGQIRTDLLYKKQLADTVVPFGEAYNSITYAPSHGDCNSLQMLCGEDTIRAVIDFSAASTLPVTWEIMRCYIQSSNVGINGAELDTEDFCSYVRTYKKYAPLTEADLANMPKVYLFQLSRSAYGYKQFLLSDGENGESLLQFAFRRTEICRLVERKLDELSCALRNLRSDV